MSRLIAPIVERERSFPKELSLDESEKRRRFEAVALPHLAAAYNLARWITRNDHDAEDVVQEAYLRAFRSFDGFHGGDTRPWLLAIVRNTSINSLKRRSPRSSAMSLDESANLLAADVAGPDERMLQAVNHELVCRALDELPEEFREVVVLREMEGLSYKEVAEVTDTPIGTVMSRLARGRKLLRVTLTRGQPEAFGRE